MMDIYCSERSLNNNGEEMEIYGMDLREQIRFMDTRDFQALNRVPEWARAEKMEMSVPLNELWRAPDDAAKNNKPFNSILGKIRNSFYHAQEMLRHDPPLKHQKYQLKRRAA